MARPSKTVRKVRKKLAKRRTKKKAKKLKRKRKRRRRKQKVKKKVKPVTDEVKATKREVGKLREETGTKGKKEKSGDGKSSVAKRVIDTLSSDFDGDGENLASEIGIDMSTRDDDRRPADGVDQLEGKVGGVSKDVEELEREMGMFHGNGNQSKQSSQSDRSVEDPFSMNRDADEEEEFLL